MKKHTTMAITFLGMLTLAFGIILAGDHPLKSSNKKSSWQLVYDEKHPHGEHAYRLVVGDVDTSGGSKQKVTGAILYRFTCDAANGKYVLKKEGGKVDNLTGDVDAVPEKKGKNHWTQKHAIVELNGSYKTASGDTRVVGVRGHIHSGSKNGKGKRDDDRVVLFVLDEDRDARFSAALKKLRDEGNWEPEKIRQLIFEFLRRLPCDEIAPADAAIEETDADGNLEELPYTPEAP
jgi:hypothetical protein